MRRALTAGLLILSALLAALAQPAVALAADPIVPTQSDSDAAASNPPLVGQPANDTAPQALTREERRLAVDKRRAAAEIERGRLPRSAFDGEVPAGAPARESVYGTSAAAFGLLDMRPRQQVNCAYCGPATGQVIINHSRGLFSNNLDGWSRVTNVFDQGQIAWHMGTDGSGTTGGGMAQGLNRLARMPANFIYIFDPAGNGGQWHAKVISDISGSRMGLAPAVAPWERGATFRLSSWSAFSPGVRHWIPVRGYHGQWDGTRGPIIFYTDSSAGCGAGSTGYFSDPSLDVHHTIQMNSGMIVW